MAYIPISPFQQEAVFQDSLLFFCALFFARFVFCAVCALCVARCAVYGVRCSVCGARCSLLGVRCSVYGVWCVVYGVI